MSACFTTMGAGQPSKITAEELKRIDVEIPTSFAKASKTAGCVRHMSILTSTGADANCKPSRFSGTIAGGGLYLGLKGQVRCTISRRWCFFFLLVVHICCKRGSNFTRLISPFFVVVEYLADPRDSTVATYPCLINSCKKQPFFLCISVFIFRPPM